MTNTADANKKIKVKNQKNVKTYNKAVGIGGFWKVPCEKDAGLSGQID